MGAAGTVVNTVIWRRLITQWQQAWKKNKLVNAIILIRGGAEAANTLREWVACRHAEEEEEEGEEREEAGVKGSPTLLTAEG